MSQKASKEALWASKSIPTTPPLHRNTGLLAAARPGPPKGWGVVKGTVHTPDKSSILMQRRIEPLTEHSESR